MRFQKKLPLSISFLFWMIVPCVRADNVKIHTAHLKDVTSVEGVRDNMLMGYGLVAGLNGTGDRQQTIFSTQSLASMLQKMGVTVGAPATMLVHNIAAVFVTATLPAFSQPGMRIDATISSIGDAKSLEGGTLLLTSLFGPDGQVYGVAQGGVVLGGYSAGGRGNSKVVNHPTVARISGGVLVERDTSVNLRNFTSVSLLLHNPDYATARDVAAAVNRELGKDVAQAIDSRRVEISGIEKGTDSVPRLLARIEELSVQFTTPAKVVVNERTNSSDGSGCASGTMFDTSREPGNRGDHASGDFATAGPRPGTNRGCAADHRKSSGRPGAGNSSGRGRHSGRIDPRIAIHWSHGPGHRRYFASD